MKTEFKSTGVVLGNCWGGGRGGYVSKNLTGESKEDILEQATEGLDGSLDGGMGFESLVGAILVITKITTIEQDGKEFENKECEIDFVGNLTEEDREFLETCLNCY